MAPLAARPAPLRNGVPEVKQWWDTHFVRSEYQPDGAGYPKMPDDWTPRMTGGAALSGHRRTYRRTYTGAGVSVRMPSATAIKSYSGAVLHSTFDVPVQADYPGGSVSGWVRVTKMGPNEYAVSGLDFGDKENALVSEAVSAVLEARRPSVALRDVGDLLKRRRDRFAAAGTKVDATPRSGFISGVGYNKLTGVMGVTIGTRAYAYEVPEVVFEKVRGAHSPGEMYNLLVKGRGRRVEEITACPRCGRFNAASAKHRCPSKHGQPTENTIAQNVSQRAAAARSHT